MVSIEDIIEATGGELVSKGAACLTGVSIDSRTIKKGELFIALKGERFDGHEYVAKALETGGGAVINRTFNFQLSTFKDKAVIRVDDTLRALQDLAAAIRRKFTGPVIGVIGSNGKTTTKELIAAILGTRWKVLKTMGNLNNHIGMPLSIAGAEADVRAMVLEMGTNRPGDVDGLCRIAPPDTGVVTNIGYEHLEGFGSLEKVRDSELEITPYVKTLVLNADDAFLMKGAREKIRGAKGAIRVVSFGINAEADVSAGDIVLSDGAADSGARYSLRAGGGRLDINSQLSGHFNIYNSLAAAAAAYAVGLGLKEIKAGLESFRGVNMRFEVREECGVTYLNDSYNANPSSMEESVKELARRVGCPGDNGCRRKRAIAVLGDMLELGDYAVAAHENLGKRMSELPVEIFIGAGPLMAHAVAGFRGKGIHVGGSEEAGRELEKVVREGDVVLIKGSRGMRMEKVLSILQKSGTGEAARLSGGRGE
ncbi:MAG TPA: UDP-N-acetylmuramoyl-tripeptide--D-alanyl-D-alanine ligase [Dissulfurispiraceae bacterium]